MPFKHHAARPHHIPKPRYRITSGPEYDAALRQRASLTVWFTDAAIAAWQAEARTTPGGQRRYSALAITTALTLRAVFGLALRQTEGFIGSIIDLLGLDLAAFDPEPPGQDAARAAAPKAWNRPAASARGQHRGEAGRCRRMAGGETRHLSAAILSDDPDVLRASEFQHPVQGGRSDSRGSFSI